jgi:hypothetical protein
MTFFHLKDKPDVGEVEKIVITQDGMGESPAWLVNRVYVVHCWSGRCLMFCAERWCAISTAVFNTSSSDCWFWRSVVFARRLSDDLGRSCVLKPSPMVDEVGVLVETEHAESTAFGSDTDKQSSSYRANSVMWDTFQLVSVSAWVKALVSISVTELQQIEADLLDIEVSTVSDFALLMDGRSKDDLRMFVGSGEDALDAVWDALQSLYETDANVSRQHIVDTDDNVVIAKAVNEEQAALLISTAEENEVARITRGQAADAAAVASAAAAEAAKIALDTARIKSEEEDAARKAQQEAEVAQLVAQTVESLVAALEETEEIRAAAEQVRVAAEQAESYRKVLVAQVGKERVAAEATLAEATLLAEGEMENRRRIADKLQAVRVKAKNVQQAQSRHRRSRNIARPTSAEVAQLVSNTMLKVKNDEETSRIDALEFVEIHGDRAREFPLQFYRQSNANKTCTIREDIDKSSAQVGTILPGQIVKIESVLDFHRQVRAKICFGWISLTGADGNTLFEPVDTEPVEKALAKMANPGEHVAVSSDLTGTEEQVLGTVTVRVLSAAGIAAADGKSKSDPYTRVNIDYTSEWAQALLPPECKTPALSNTLNPVWSSENSFEFAVYSLSDILCFQVFSRNSFKKDVFLGVGRLSCRRTKSSDDGMFSIELETSTEQSVKKSQDIDVKGVIFTHVEFLALNVFEHVTADAIVPSPPPDVTVVIREVEIVLLEIVEAICRELNVSAPDSELEYELEIEPTLNVQRNAISAAGDSEAYDQVNRMEDLCVVTPDAATAMKRVILRHEELPSEPVEQIQRMRDAGLINAGQAAAFEKLLAMPEAEADSITDLIAGVNSLDQGGVNMFLDWPTEDEAGKARIFLDEGKKKEAQILAARETQLSKVAAEQAVAAKFLGEEKSRLAAKEAEIARSTAEQEAAATLVAEEAAATLMAKEQAEAAAVKEAEAERLAVQHTETARVAAEEAQKAKATEEAEAARETAADLNVVAAPPVQGGGSITVGAKKSEILETMPVGLWLQCMNALSESERLGFEVELQGMGATTVGEVVEVMGNKDELGMFFEENETAVEILWNCLNAVREDPSINWGTYLVQIPPASGVDTRLVSGDGQLEESIQIDSAAILDTAMPDGVTPVPAAEIDVKTKPGVRPPASTSKEQDIGLFLRSLGVLDEEGNEALEAELRDMDVSDVGDVEELLTEKDDLTLFVEDNEEAVNKLWAAFEAVWNGLDPIDSQIVNAVSSEPEPVAELAGALDTDAKTATADDNYAAPDDGQVTGNTQISVWLASLDVMDAPGCDAAVEEFQDMNVITMDDLIEMLEEKDDLALFLGDHEEKAEPIWEMFLAFKETLDT